MSIRLIDHDLEFLHLPKTGGVWVEKALVSSGIRIKRFGHEHGTYDRVLAEKLTGNGWLPPRLGRRIFQTRRKLGRPVLQPKRFCFVRNPFKWYESYWRFMMEHDWFMYGYPNDPERWHPWSDLLHIQESDFNRFIERVIKERPAYLSSLYLSFCKPGMTYIGKTESLSHDLEMILKLENVSHTSEAILEQGKANTSDSKKLPIEWEPDFRKALYLSEFSAFTVFDYGDEETQHFITGTRLSSSYGPHPCLLQR